MTVIFLVNGTVSSSLLLFSCYPGQLPAELPLNACMKVAMNNGSLSIKPNFPLGRFPSLLWALTALYIYALWHCCFSVHCFFTGVSLLLRCELLKGWVRVVSLLHLKDESSASSIRWSSRQLIFEKFSTVTTLCFFSPGQNLVIQESGLQKDQPGERVSLFKLSKK